MTKVHHYMVDFEDADGGVMFANEVELYSLDDAKALAKATSIKTDTAAVVAFADNGDGTFKGVGHVMFCHGEVSDTDGITA